MRISDWSSDVCSSDLQPLRKAGVALRRGASRVEDVGEGVSEIGIEPRPNRDDVSAHHCLQNRIFHGGDAALVPLQDGDCFKEAFHRLVLFIQYAGVRSEEHTSELKSLIRISYAVYCLKKKNKNKKHI